VPLARQKPDRCPRCDARFGCGIGTGTCWCAEVQLTAERQAQLAAEFDGCLCPECLRELEQGTSPAVAVEAPVH
jgi:hypothetical protein